MLHANIRVTIGECRRRQLYIEFELCARIRAHEPCVAFPQHLKKVRVSRVYADRDPADRNHHAVVPDLYR